VLKQRVLTALVLVPLVVWALFRLPTWGLAILLGIFVLGAAWEWSALAGLKGTAARAAYVLALAVFGYVGLLVDRTVVIALGVAWWAWALAEMALFKQLDHGMLRRRAGKLVAGALVLVPAWVASLHLHAVDPRTPWALLFLFVLVWSADSAAYFVGKRFGRHKIAPHISPGKSYQGLFGAMGAVLVLAALSGRFLFDYSGGTLLMWICVALLATLFSLVGDLMESRIKRIAGVKDSGALLPGHGGICDRIDGFTAAAPVFAVGMMPLLPGWGA